MVCGEGSGVWRCVGVVVKVAMYGDDGNSSAMPSTNVQPPPPSPVFCPRERLATPEGQETHPLTAHHLLLLLPPQDLQIQTILKRRNVLRELSFKGSIFHKHFLPREAF